MIRVPAAVKQGLDYRLKAMRIKEESSGWDKRKLKGLLFFLARHFAAFVGRAKLHDDLGEVVV